MKKITCMLIILTAVLLGGSLFVKPVEVSSNSKENFSKENTSLNIVTTTKLQYYMVKSIVKDKHKVDFLLKDEDNINEFNITKEVSNKLSDIDLFIYNGFYRENWTAKLINKLNRDKVGIVDMSRGVKPISNEVTANENISPYYALSFDEYKVALYNIKLAIQDKDTKNRDLYEENYEKTIKDFKVVLDSKVSELGKYKIQEKYKFVTDTTTFDYFFRALGLNVDVISGNKEIDNNDKKEIIYIKSDSQVNKEKVDKDKVDNETKVIFLQGYDKDKSAMEMILSNIDLILQEIKKIDKIG